MNKIPYSQMKKGTLLVATPNIDSGLFCHGVIILCEHGPSGSFGLVINKPLDIEIPNDIINVQGITNPNIGIRAGGPVQTNQMMLLHNSISIPGQTFEVSEGVYIGGDLSFLQNSIVDNGGPTINICFGYVGWAHGQLEREFLDGKWFLHPSSPHHIFSTPVDRMWQSILLEMGGRYATLSMIPEDLSLN
ncbi:MAG: YqgE/AlgH family protein [Waddliaceae bacterium]|nr:YqgE/AlgH family protein [Waddliaceae bacterium]MBT3579289.1 YqgE/AlgH family protein [Waddliaceae bacterium]MBT4444514.1 YqgE/AlgH family protein [Waddliaceae bacterium]MBT6928442.1 YqgE/AlgH family protein [Waddliaceae bacterium]MBT7264088.1 YqgE/AlgH family protein [Waddliaceae bacterium]